MDHYGVRVSEGQKASFCLEDNDCDAEVSAVYDCENYGDQGITPGCKVIAIYSIMRIVLRQLFLKKRCYLTNYICLIMILLQDIYHANIDCQWLDVTELPTGVYTFKLSINPEFKVNTEKI